MNRNLAEPDLTELAWIGLGSNLGDSVRTFVLVAKRLEAHSEILLLRSSLWRTSPVDCPPGSPAFVNAVLGIRPPAEETPAVLLDQLQALEREFGRSSKRLHNEARPLDLDLIMFGRVVSADPNLTLPHPRAHLRRFVLQPLAELAPHLKIPGTAGTVVELLNRLKTDEELMRLGSWPED